MKTTFVLILTLLFVLLTFAEADTQWGLPEGVKARLGKGRTLELAYSPDGKYLAMGSYVGIWLYNTAHYQARALLTGHTGEITSVGFSPDGRRLASGSLDGTIRLWDVGMGQTLRLLTGHHAVLSISFSSDDQTLASGG